MREDVSTTCLFLLLEFLFSIAMADGELHAAEKDILGRTAGFLGIGNRQFEQLLAMLTAQQSFNGGQYQGYQQGSQRASIDELGNAYQARGVTSSESDREIKKAYRKLMSQPPSGQADRSRCSRRYDQSWHRKSSGNSSSLRSH